MKRENGRDQEMMFVCLVSYGSSTLVSWYRRFAEPDTTELLTCTVQIQCLLVLRRTRLVLFLLKSVGNPYTDVYSVMGANGSIRTAGAYPCSLVLRRGNCEVVQGRRRY